MHSALPFLFISSIPLHCPLPNGWAQCPLPTFQVGPIFSPSCAWLRGCVKVGTVCVFADTGSDRMKRDWRGAIVLKWPCWQRTDTNKDDVNGNRCVCVRERPKRSVNLYDWCLLKPDWHKSSGDTWKKYTKKMTFVDKKCWSVTWHRSHNTAQQG